MTIPRRPLAFLWLLSCLLASLGVVWWITASTHNINEATVAMVQDGMTEAEVEALFGVPAGNHTFPQAEMFFITGRRILAPSPSCKDWVGDEVGIRVAFNANGRVSWSQRGYVAGQVSLIDRVRRWLRL